MPRDEVASEFVARAKVLGHRSEMFTAEKQPHGFFHRSPWLEKTLYRADEFLASLGYLEGKPTIAVPDSKTEKPSEKPVAQPQPNLPPPTSSPGTHSVVSSTNSTMRIPSGAASAATRTPT